MCEHVAGCLGSMEIGVGVFGPADQPGGPAL